MTKMVVLHFLNGDILEGELSEFDSSSQVIRVRTRGDDRVVDCSLLKAVFYLRDPEHSPYSDAWLRPGAKKIRVTFADGEEMSGYSYGLHPQDQGFHFFPVATGDRNERIYVVRKNTIRIRTEAS